MKQSWLELIAWYRKAQEGRDAGDGFVRSLRALEELAGFVSDYGLVSGLHAGTSMYDLCIQQVDASDLELPYLRISPLQGELEFRYFDTNIVSRQWSRRVPPEAVIPRFRAFLDQAGWVPRFSVIGP
jgi:hypothetical protein